MAMLTRPWRMDLSCLEDSIPFILVHLEDYPNILQISIFNFLSHSRIIFMWACMAGYFDLLMDALHHLLPQILTIS